LATRGLRPRHRWGQNFLHDHNQIRKLLAAADVKPGELVLEVGPGTGTLTEALLDAGARVLACEIDPQMAAIAAERLASLRPEWGRGNESPSHRLVVGDCLDGKRSLHPELRCALADEPFVLVANLPYGAATPLMATLLVSHENCRGIFVTVQREVADRLAAQPATRAYGPLSIIAQLAAEVKLLSILPGSCFWPAPDVTSAMVALHRRSSQRPLCPGAPASPQEREALADFASSLFETRRKQLGTILGRGSPLPPGISATARAEELAIPDLVRLWRARQA